MAAGTFTVRGQRVRTGSTRRYVMFAQYGDGAWRVCKRSDNYATLATLRMREGRSAQTRPIIDTVTGVEVPD